MTDQPGRQEPRSLPEGLRYFRKRTLPQGWWPWGVLPVAGLLVLFLVGAFGIAGQMQRQTADAVSETLKSFGISGAQITAEGQAIRVRAVAPEYAAPQIQMLAASAACPTWLGRMTCPTSVQVTLIEPGSGRVLARAGGASEAGSQTSAAPSAGDTGRSGAQQPPIRAHDFEFQSTGDAIVLHGEVPSEAVKQRLIEQAGERFSRVTAKLVETGDRATDQYELATQRAVFVLEKARSGHARWVGGRLDIQVDADSAARGSLRQAFNQPQFAPPLGQLRIHEESAEQDCADALAATLAEGPVTFERGNDRLTDAGRKRVGALAAVANRCPGQLIVEGHTDNIGRQSDNQALSLRRARAVAVALAEHGIDAGRMRTRGVGESEPVADNATEAGRARNRRIVVRLDAPPSPSPATSVSTNVDCATGIDDLARRDALNFETGQSALDQAGREAMDALASILGRCEGVLFIESHTDNGGLQGDNRSLSLSRAAAVAGALEERGIASQRLRTLGLGEDLPVASNDDAAGRETNRRLQFELVDPAALPDAADCNTGLDSLLAESGIQFRVGSHDITDDSQLVISRLARQLQRCPGPAVIAGHTDAMGDEIDNQRLSWRRAREVSRGLSSRGLQHVALYPVGFGESEPAASNDSEAGRARNRRIEVRVEPQSPPAAQARACNNELAGLLTPGAIEFDTGSDRLSAASRDAVTDLAAVVKRCPGSLIIAGHTDDVGEADNNQQLSWQRARAVKAALVTAGVRSERLRAVGFGEARPVAVNDSSDGRALNRRIEIYSAPRE